ncbi:Coenzyme F420 hydrogenase/dehydrogenase, beta subunit C-terminal domain [Mesorhizobium sp. KR2-14]|uniref:Coenzyme F420 hydrogenase/dehydrogenase, beta subunit C-terminal domain n=1 Tax=Mesorhizobium sp. KR2-14 TaxID=3156610 RepID=UPI0032B5ECF9
MHDGMPLSPRAVVDAGLCIGCGACAAYPGSGEVDMELDRYGLYKPAGSAAWLSTPSAEFSRLCPFSPAASSEEELASSRFPQALHDDPLLGRYEALYVGHVEEGRYRQDGSSGGLATWLATELLRVREVDRVVHVVETREPEGTLFRYTISDDESDVRSGAKSRYYPVELSGVLRRIRAEPGRYAVVGIPCMVKTVQLVCQRDEIVRERVRYCIGLVCGHMKSTRFTESFARQSDVKRDAICGVDYRVKRPERPASWYRVGFRLRGGGERQRDWWHMLEGDWGAGFFQSPACDFCDDVMAELADACVGDAWQEPYSSDGRGTNIAVVRSRRIMKLLQDAAEAGRISLTGVDSKFAVSTQAAAFRHRREGLAYRLKKFPPPLALKKRVADISSLSPRRRAIYRLRRHISRWSHRVFCFSQLAHLGFVYVVWARTAASLYAGVTYSRGAPGKIADRIFRGTRA